MKNSFFAAAILALSLSSCMTPQERMEQDIMRRTLDFSINVADTKRLHLNETVMATVVASNISTTTNVPVAVVSSRPDIIAVEYLDNNACVLSQQNPSCTVTLRAVGDPNNIGQPLQSAITAMTVMPSTAGSLAVSVYPDEQK